MFKIQDPQDPTTKIKELLSQDMTAKKKYERQNANFMKIVPNPGDVIMCIFWAFNNSVMLCGLINAFLNT